MRRVWLVGGAVLFAMAGSPVHGAGPIAVNSVGMAINGGDAQCTLVEAIRAANTDTPSGAIAGECVAGSFGLDVIQLPAGLYTIAAPTSSYDGPNALPEVKSPIEIVGAGAGVTTIERSAAPGTPDFRIFYVQYTGLATYERTGSLVLRGVTIRNGRLPGAQGGAMKIQSTNQPGNAVIDSVFANSTGGVGGAIFATVPQFTIRGSTFDSNTGNSAGAVSVNSILHIEDSLFVANRAVAGDSGAVTVGFGGTINATRSVFKGNVASSRAGAINSGAGYVNITGSQVIGNRAGSNGGILAKFLEMSDTTVADNVATGAIGGIGVVRTAGAWGVVRDSTIRGNRSGGTGGGIDGGNLTLSNTTVSGNFAVSRAGGISACGPGATFTGYNITVVNNTASSEFADGGGVCFSEFSTLANSVIAGNFTGAAGRTPDCYTTHPVTSLGHNTIGNTCNCAILQAAGDDFGTATAPIDPLFASLATNGGPTPTHLLRPGSPAIDTASPLPPGSEPAACTGRDQRGVVRPADGDGDGTATSDRGAVEMNGSPSPARPVLTDSTYSVDEPSGGVTITVARDDSSGDTQLDFRVVAGNATDGTDFLSTSGTLAFLDGESAKTFSVVVLDDVDFESPEGVLLELRSAGAPLTDQPYSSAMLFIKDDESFPYVRRNDVTVAEGSAGLQTVPVTVDLYQPYPYGVTVSYSTVDDSAQAGSDYLSIAGSFTVAAGNVTGTIQLPIIGDTEDEADERLAIRLVTTVGCTSEVRVVTVTIRDDDLTNRGPSVEPVPDQLNQEGDTVGVNVSGSDPDGDALEFAATGLPPGLSIDPSTGAIGGVISAGAAATHTVSIVLSDGKLSAGTTFTWVVTALPPPPPANVPPVCSAARPSMPIVWPPNHRQTYDIDILGVSDPDGGSVGIVITSIWQDEPTNTLGDGTTWIDGGGVGTATAWIRAERMGGADGRVYHIAFIATDAGAASCTGVVSLGVPHDQSRPSPGDGGALFDSTRPTAAVAGKKKN
jgi:hypothetical protein